MRNLSELNVNERGRPVERSAPLQCEIDEFQSHFGIIFPQDYLALLRYSNGGHPELNTLNLNDGENASMWSINNFYFLNADKCSNGSLWVVTDKWQSILGKKTIPFAADEGGNQFILDFSISSPTVKICVHDYNFAVVNVAPTFEAFIDALSTNLDMI